MNISQYIDHTNLKAFATEADIVKICSEADEYKFYAVCVNSSHVNTCVAYKKVHNATYKIASVVGFPLGASLKDAKVYESNQSIELGADEIDMVINIGWLKDKNYKAVFDEIADIKKVIGQHILKVIIETCYLTDEEKKIASQIVCDAGADFVKTSTGFGTGGATIPDIILMKSCLTNQVQIKASGGIKDYISAKEYIDLGVTRIGTSQGIEIFNQSKLIEK
ncbi:MAG: deoxyribose-phosphate aldolase [Bacteroidetes bacterium]|nr:deoxyribose-phosphate aldolase [Bacteroidota bacterium]